MRRLLRLVLTSTCALTNEKQVLTLLTNERMKVLTSAKLQQFVEVRAGVVTRQTHHAVML